MREDLFEKGPLALSQKTLSKLYTRLLQTANHSYRFTYLPIAEGSIAARTAVSMISGII